MHWVTLFTCSVVCLMVSGANADVKTNFQQVESEFWEWRLKQNPLFAVDAGRMDYVDQNQQVGVQVLEDRYKEAQKLLKQIENVKSSDLDKSTKMSYRVLKSQLDTYIDGYKFKEFTYNYINFLEGPHIGFNHLIKKLPFKNATDYENFLKHLTGFATQIGQIQDLLKEAVKQNKSMHDVSVNRVPAQLNKILDKPYDKTDYYVPFNETLDALSLTSVVKTDLRTRAKAVIENKIYTAFTALRNYLNTGYKTRSGLGVSTMAATGSPSGTEYYAAALKWHLSVDMDPKKVHELGLEQVKRIKGNMMDVMTSLNFNGTLKEFIASLKANSSFFLKTEEELLQRYRDIINKRIQSTLPKLFLELPQLKLEVRSMTNDGPGGFYMAGTPDGSVPGVFEANVRNPQQRVKKNEAGAGPSGYYIFIPNASGSYTGLFVANVKNPKTRPTFDMLALCLHEANPGHHMQISYMLTDKNIPNFRRYADYSGYYQAPFHFPFYTAYTEGWALYAEYLGTELGLYDDKYELFGRYVSEMFRACRLVVDTGLHVMNWTRQEAIDYMAEHITDPISQISVEIDRYVTWPGQACAYKVGEIKILEMRHKAEKALGSKFNVKKFHQRILTSAALPLELLEVIIDEYISETLIVSSGNKVYMSISVLLMCLLSKLLM